MRLSYDREKNGGPGGVCRSKRRRKRWKNICKRTLCAALALGMALLPAGATNWGLWYGNGLHQPPNGEDTVQTLAKYGAYYMGSAAEKTLYLTFDCGYENGNTAKILDTLKKQHVPGAFFVVGDYLKTAPALVKRMGDEGHLVCNHTYNHPNHEQGRPRTLRRGADLSQCAV